MGARPWDPRGQPRSTWPGTVPASPRTPPLCLTSRPKTRWSCRSAQGQAGVFSRDGEGAPALGAGSTVGRK